MIHIEIMQLEVEIAAINTATVHQKDLSFKLLKFVSGVVVDKTDKQKI
jgi:hypothetical protein